MTDKEFLKDTEIKKDVEKACGFAICSIRHNTKEQADFVESMAYELTILRKREDLLENYSRDEAISFIRSLNMFTMARFREVSSSLFKAYGYEGDERAF